MSISVRQIEAFRAVMICGTTKAAAELMHVSQPVISKLIVLMESRLGYRLFERTGNAIVPNEYARKLFEEALRVQEQVEQFGRFAKALGQPETGSLTIYVSPALATTLLPSVVAHYHRYFPKVRVNIINQKVENISRKLLVDPDSVGLTIWPIDDPAIECTVLTSRPVKILMRSDHRFVRTLCDLNFEDLQSENMIIHSDSLPFGDAVRAQMARYDFEWLTPFTVNSSEIAYSLVAQNLGLFLCDAFASKSLNARDLVVRDIVSDIETSVCLLHSRFRPPGRFVRPFIEIVQEQLDQQ